MAPAELIRRVLHLDPAGDALCLPPRIFHRPREVDGLVVVQTRSSRILHIEFQTRADRDLGRRMLRYRVGLEEKHPEVDQHVVLLHPDAYFEGVSRYEAPGLRLTYEVHQLWDIDPEEFLPAPLIAPLAPLGRAANDQEREMLVERAAARIAELEPPLKSQATGWLSLLGTLYLSSETLEELIRRSAMAIHLEDFPLARKWRAESEAIGEARGQAMDLAELVRLKYGDEALANAVSEVDPAAFDGLRRVLLNGDRDEFAAWLAAHRG